MAEGEKVRGSVRLAPETFVALPSTLGRMRQHRIALSVGMLERDYHLWRLDRYPSEPSA